MKLPLSIVAIVTTVLIAGGCGSSENTTEPTKGPEPAQSAVPIVLPTAAKKFTLTSSAFGDGKPIPAKYTCQADGLLPPLAWSGDLAGGTSVAIVVDDPDAPDGGFVHWLVVGLPAKPPAALDPEKLPDGATVGANSDGDPGWSPPCPPSGTHHYRFTAYSLDGSVDVSDGTDPVEALRKIGAHAKAYAQLTGTVAAA